MPAAYTSLAPWFGAKRTLAPRIIETIGPHRAYWEPFCGSMAVLLNKPPVSMETVNDLHGDIINLARVVQSPDLGADLYDRLRRTLPAETLFRDSAAVIRGEVPADPAAPPSVTRAYHYFVTSWLGMNGTAGVPPGSSATFARRFSSKGGAPAVRFGGAVESLPWWHERLRGVMILSADGFEIIDRVEDRDGTAIYADPPYLIKGAKYLHDFVPDDHRRLAAALNRFKRTRVVVSYYDHPDLDALYPGWLKIDCSTAKAMVNTGMRTEGRTNAPEILLVKNGTAQPPSE